MTADDTDSASTKGAPDDSTDTDNSTGESTPEDVPHAAAVHIGREYLADALRPTGQCGTGEFATAEDEILEIVSALEAGDRPSQYSLGNAIHSVEMTLHALADAAWLRGDDPRRYMHTQLYNVLTESPSWPARPRDPETETGTDRGTNADATDTDADRDGEDHARDDRSDATDTPSDGAALGDRDPLLDEASDDVLRAALSLHDELLLLAQRGRYADNRPADYADVREALARGEDAVTRLEAVEDGRGGDRDDVDPTDDHR